MNNPQEYCPDDTVCFRCNGPLSEDDCEGTPEFEGYCSTECLWYEEVSEWFGADIRMEMVDRAKVMGIPYSVLCIVDEWLCDNDKQGVK